MSSCIAFSGDANAAHFAAGVDEHALATSHARAEHASHDVLRDADRWFEFDMSLVTLELVLALCANAICSTEMSLRLVDRRLVDRNCRHDAID